MEKSWGENLPVRNKSLGRGACFYLMKMSRRNTSKKFTPKLWQILKVFSGHFRQTQNPEIVGCEPIYKISYPKNQFKYRFMIYLLFQISWSFKKDCK